MRKLIGQIVVQGLITHVKTSNKRRPVYYNVHKHTIPKMYQNINYWIDKEGFVKDKLTKNKVLKNKRAVGTPKFQKINGQDFYSGFSTPHIRNLIVKEIKNFFKTSVKHKKIDLTMFPIQLEMELHKPFEDGDWDLDNLWIYNKCFQDVLQDLKIIPDDNVQYITKPGSPEYFPVDTWEEAKIVYNIYQDLRPEILNSKYYEKKNSSN
jgi:hypothetical protein